MSSTLVLHAAPEAYTCGSRNVLEIAAGPGGFISAMLLAVVVKNRSTYEVSLWHHLSGMARIGSGTLKNVTTSGSAPSAQASTSLAATALLWHPDGHRLVVVAAGTVFLLHVTYHLQHGASAATVAFAEICALDADNDVSSDVGPRAKLQRISSIAMAATSAALAENGKGAIITIGTAQGAAYRLNWEGDVLSAVAISRDHELLRPWIPQSFPLANTPSSVAATSSVSSLDALPLEFERDDIVSSLSSLSTVDEAFNSEGDQMNDDAPGAASLEDAPGTAVIVCDASAKSQLLLLRTHDGGIALLAPLKSIPSSSSSAATGQRHVGLYNGTRRIHIVTRLTTAVTKGGSIITRTNVTGSAGPSSGRDGKEVVSKVLCARLVEAALGPAVICVLETRHWPEEGSRVTNATTNTTSSGNCQYNYSLLMLDIRAGDVKTDYSTATAALLREGKEIPPQQQYLALHRAAYRHIGSTGAASAPPVITLVHSSTAEPLVLLLDTCASSSSSGSIAGIGNLVCLRLDLSTTLFVVVLALPALHLGSLRLTLGVVQGKVLVGVAGEAPESTSTAVHLLTFLHCPSGLMQGQSFCMLADGAAGALLLHRSADGNVTPRLLSSTADDDEEAGAQASLHTYGGFIHVQLPLAARVAERRALIAHAAFGHSNVHSALLVAATRQCRHITHQSSSSSGGGLVPGYLAITASGGGCDTLWLYSLKTRRWRSAGLGLGPGSAAALCMPMSLGQPARAGVSSTPSSLPPSSGTSTILSLNWLGDNTLLLLTSREGGTGTTPSYLLELVSREASRESLASGKPMPLLHTLWYLPQGLVPRFVDCVTGLDWAKADGGRASAIVVGDGKRFLCFRVGPVLAAASSGSGRDSRTADYVVEKLWDVVFIATPASQYSISPLALSPVPTPAPTQTPGFASSSAISVVQMLLLVRAESEQEQTQALPVGLALLLSSGEGVILDILAPVPATTNPISSAPSTSSGSTSSLLPLPPPMPQSGESGWTYRRRRVGLSKEASFKEMRAVSMATLLATDEQDQQHDREGVLFLPAAGGGEGSLYLPIQLKGETPGAIVPTPNLPSGASFFGLSQGTRLTVQQRLPPLVVGSESSARATSALAAVMLQPGGAACVTADPLCFSVLVFLAARLCVQGGLDDSSTPKPGVVGVTPTVVARRLLVRLQQSPNALQLLAEHLETALKALVGHLAAPGGGEQFVTKQSNAPATLYEVSRAYSQLLHLVFLASPVLCCELLSSLGRKLESHVAKLLLPPLPLPVLGSNRPATPAPLLSLQHLFEWCLHASHTRLASRLLVLACDAAGGTETTDSTMRCLCMALELARCCFDTLALPLAIECMHFAGRLEQMMDLIAFSSSTRGRARAALVAQGGSESSTALTLLPNRNFSAPTIVGVTRSLLATLAAVSPALSYLLSLPLQAGAALLGGNGNSAGNSNAFMYGDSADRVGGGAGAHRPYTYLALPAAQRRLGPARVNELLYSGRGVHGGPCFTSALLEAVCRGLLSSQRYGAIGCVSSAMLGSREGRDCVKGALAGASGGFTMPSTKATSGTSGSALAAGILHALRLSKLHMSSSPLSKKLQQATPASFFRQLCERDLEEGGRQGEEDSGREGLPPSFELPASCCAHGHQLRQVLVSATLALLLVRGGDSGSSANGAGAGHCDAAACLMVVLGLPTLAVLTLCVAELEGRLSASTSSTSTSTSGGNNSAAAASSSTRLSPSAQAAVRTDSAALRQYIALHLLHSLERPSAAGAEEDIVETGESAAAAVAASSSQSVPASDTLPLSSAEITAMRAALLPLLSREVTVLGAAQGWDKAAATVRALALAVVQRLCEKASSNANANVNATDRTRSRANSVTV